MILSLLAQTAEIWPAIGIARLTGDFSEMARMASAGGVDGLEPMGVTSLTIDMPRLRADPPPVQRSDPRDDDTRAEGIELYLPVPPENNACS